MKCYKILIPGILFSTLSFIGCGGGGNAATPDTSKTAEVKDTASAPPVVAANPYAKGEEIYNSSCKACHQANGEGIASAFPPLAKSDYLLADKKRSIQQVLKGSSGEITVNGNKFNGAMPPQDLTDDQVADVLNFVLHSWGNNGETVTPEEVKAAR